MKTIRRRDKVSNPGVYRHYVDVKSYTKTGGSRLDYTQVATHQIYVYVSIEPVAGREKLIADQLQQKITHILKTPYRSTWQADFSNDRIIVTNSRTFYIKAALNRKEMNREIEIYCEEKV